MDKSLETSDLVLSLLKQIDNLQAFILLETGRQPDSYCSIQYKGIEKQS